MNQLDNRPSWDEYFLDLAARAARRSKDPSTKVGAVVCDQNFALVSTGYNGPPRTCDDDAVPWFELDPETGQKAKYPWVIHAEENAVTFAVAALGTYDLGGCTLYASGVVCSRCVLRIAHAGIKRVVCGPTQPGCCDERDRSLAGKIAQACGVSVFDGVPPVGFGRR